MEPAFLKLVLIRINMYLLMEYAMNVILLVRLVLKKLLIVHSVVLDTIWIRRREHAIKYL